MKGETEKLFVCVKAVQSSAALCSQAGGRKRKEGRNRGDGLEAQAATMHLLACRLGLGTWGWVVLLYRTTYRGLLEATGQTMRMYKPDVIRKREVCNTRREVSCMTANAPLCSSPLHPSRPANVSLSIAGDKGRKDCLCEAQKAPPRPRFQQ